MEYLNDEVCTDVWCITVANCLRWIVTLFSTDCKCISLTILANKFDGVFAVNSYLVTAIITKRPSEMCKTLFRKVQHSYTYRYLCMAMYV